MSKLTEFLKTNRGMNMVVFALGQFAMASWMVDLLTQKWAAVVSWVLLSTASGINMYMYGDPSPKPKETV